MPVANYKTYCTMLDRARTGRFAFPVINVTSLTTANAVLRGLAESKSDGIIQISTGGGAFASGSSLKDLVLEIETGAVGGEEDDVVGEKSAKLYTTPEDTLEVARRPQSDWWPIPARSHVWQRPWRL
jgi:fructose/tagatose bisphosphate aldolase